MVLRVQRKRSKKFGRWSINFRALTENPKIRIRNPNPKSEIRNPKRSNSVGPDSVQAQKQLPSNTILFHTSIARPPYTFTINPLANIHKMDKLPSAEEMQGTYSPPPSSAHQNLGSGYSRKILTNLLPPLCLPCPPFLTPGP